MIDTLCKNCNNEIQKECKVDITVNNKTHSFNLCESCALKIIKSIDKEAIKLTKEKPKKKVDKQTEESKETLETKSIKPKQKRQRKTPSLQKIKDYGEDRVKDEYENTDITAKDLALQIGIAKATLGAYLQRNNIKKNRNREYNPDNKEGY